MTHRFYRRLMDAVDPHLVDQTVSITGAHRLACDAEQRLIHEVPKLRTASIHAYPAHRQDLADSGAAAR